MARIGGPCLYQDADSRSASGVLVETLRLAFSNLLKPRGALGQMLGVVVNEHICGRRIRFIVAADDAMMKVSVARERPSGRHSKITSTGAKWRSLPWRPDV
jgi:hypothetical protein